MKKIGIISLFNMTNVNYGNKLQAFALNYWLRNEFPKYKIETLYFSKINDRLKTKNKPLIKRIIWRFVQFKEKQCKSNLVDVRLNRCNDFSKRYINLVPKAVSWDMLLNTDYDAIIVGSDIVWGQSRYGMSRIKFLDFNTNKPFKKIAYAASFGKNFIPTENIADVKRCLMDFTCISTRELSSVNMLEKLGIRNVIHTLDPTLLIDINVWMEIEVRPKNLEVHKNQYIFTYLLGSAVKDRKNIERIARLENLPLVVIPFANGEKNHADDLFGDIQIMDCSPEEWIWLIHNARYIITDSFHGIVFSTIFEKNFLAIQRKYTMDINDRLYDFLQLVGQLDKFVDLEKVDTPRTFVWDYTRSRDILNRKRNQSYEFLRSAIKDI